MTQPTYARAKRAAQSAQLTLEAQSRMTYEGASTPARDFEEGANR